MILQYFLSAVLLGFIVAIPPGSVTIIACQRSIQYGFGNSLFFSLGSSLSDIFYLTLVFFGISSFIAENDVLKIVLGFFCGIVLMYLGISSILSSFSTSRETVRVLNRSPFYTFISGILVTLTNPVTIVGWIAIAGNFTLVWAARFPQYRDYTVPTIALIMTGVICWFIPLTFFTGKLRHILSPRVQRVLLIVSNGILIVFGLIAFGNVYMNLKALFA